MTRASGRSEGDRPHRKLGRGDGIIACLLVAGTIYGIVGFYMEMLASVVELTFPVIAGIAAWMLFRRKAALSGGVVAAVTLILLYAVLISLADPASLSFDMTLHENVFVEPTKSRALLGLVTFTCALAAILVIEGPTGWPWTAPTKREQSFARITVWPAVLASQVLALLTIRGPLITEAAYWSPEYAKFADQQDKGLEAIGIFLTIYALIAAIRGYGWSHRMFRFTLGAMILWLVYFRLLRGERESVLMFAIVLGVLYYTFSPMRHKGIILCAFGLVTFLFLQIWAGVRWSIGEYGFLGALSSSWEAWWAGVGGSLLSIERLPQTYWNLLDTINLYDMGIRRNGATYLNLIPQAVPEAIANAVGFVRPVTEPIVLAQYVYHGGAIFLVAEAYWNWGLLGVLALAIVLGWFIVWIERFYRRLPPVFCFGYYSMFGVINGLIGGVQSLARWIEIGLLLTGLAWILMHSVGVVPSAVADQEQGAR